MNASACIGRMTHSLLLCLACGLWTPHVVVAQTPSSPGGYWVTSAPKAGTRIEVVDRVGTPTKGTLLGVSPDAVRLTSDGTTRTLPLAETSLIRRDGDPVWDGAAWGGGLFGLMFLSYNGDCDDCYSGAQLVGIRLFFAGIGAGAGALIDALIRDRRVLYQGADRTTGHTLTLVPVIGPKTGGVNLALAW